MERQYNVMHCCICKQPAAYPVIALPLPLPPVFCTLSMFPITKERTLDECQPRRPRPSFPPYTPHDPRVVLAAIGTFVKGCFRAPDVPIAEAFSTIQIKLAEAQATAAALRAGRSSSSSSVAGGKDGMRQRLVSASPSMEGAGRGAGQRPPVSPGPRWREIERIRRVSSYTGMKARYVWRLLGETREGEGSTVSWLLFVQARFAAH